MPSYQLRFEVVSDSESPVEALGEALMEAFLQVRAVNTVPMFSKTMLSAYTVVRLTGEEDR